MQVKEDSEKDDKFCHGARKTVKNYWNTKRFGAF